MTQSNTSTTKHYQQLSAEERGQIQSWHEDHYSIRQIAARLHRSQHNYRELERGTVRQLDSDYLPYYRYFADTGQAIYEQHRLKCHSYNLLNRCWLFFKMLVKALKSHLRTDSVDSFVHRFNAYIQHLDVLQHLLFIATLMLGYYR